MSYLLPFAIIPATGAVDATLPARLLPRCTKAGTGQYMNTGPRTRELSSNNIHIIFPNHNLYCDELTSYLLGTIFCIACDRYRPFAVTHSYEMQHLAMNTCVTCHQYTTIWRSFTSRRTCPSHIEMPVTIY